MHFLRSIKENKGFIKYLSNTMWLLGERTLRIIETLVVGIWLARYLGPEDFGLFSYAQAFVFLFTVFAALGLDTIVVRELIKHKKNRDIIIASSFWMKFIAAFIVFTLMAVYVNFWSTEEQVNALIFILASATIFKSFNVIDFYFQSQVLSKYVVYANALSLMLSSILKISLILLGASLLAFAWVVLIESFILALGLLYFFFKTNKTIKVKNLVFKKEVAFSLIKDSWPLMLTAFVISIYMKIDQVMIKHLLDANAVGQYAAAVKLSEAWYFIPIVIASSVFPAIVNAKKISQELYLSRLQKLYDLMVWIAIPIAVLMTFASGFLINFLYGDEYSEASSVLIIHIWTGIFVFLGVAFSKFLTTENWTKKYFHRTLLGAIFNIGLNYKLIPIYGIEGAAISILISQFISNYVYDIFDKDLHSQLKMKTKSFLPVHYILQFRK